MDEKQFKTAYVAQFLASYMAQRYDQDCLEGHPGEPYAHQPVEDALHLAECAWERLVLLSASPGTGLERLFDSPRPADRVPVREPAP